MGSRRIAIPLPNMGSTHRRITRYCKRGIIVLSICTFVLLQLPAFNYTNPHDLILTDTTNDSNDEILSMVPVALHKYLTPKSRNRSLNLQNNNSSSGNVVNGFMNYDYRPPNISEIKRHIAQYNSLQTVLNEDTFGPLQNDSVIIVIQVHTRITYLRHLIVSLAQSRDISKTLLIFSHDYYDEDINDLIQTIDFCKVMQIFYPYSIQTHPNEFPGDDPGDCPRNIKKKQAIIRKCNNALYPDLYGHYREAKFTQIKHHWWWKANRIFDQLDVTRYHTGLVLFLEEDHYVAEDFLYLLEMMQKRTLDLCPHCNVLSLKANFNQFNYDMYSSNVEIQPWMSSWGFAFNRSTWTDIRNCKKSFCTYDDYNWDWSLKYISQQCLKRKIHAMIVKGARVFHIGECGVHYKKKNCDLNQVISKVQQVLKFAKKSGQLFPRSLNLTVSSVAKTSKNIQRANGGWGDKRDHELCLNMTDGFAVN